MTRNRRLGMCLVWLGTSGLGCAASGSSSSPGPSGDGGTGGSSGIDSGYGIDAPVFDASLPDTGSAAITTCEQAAALRSNVGCDYWPTVTANGVWDIFDFAVVVSNTTGSTATVKVTGPKGFTTNAEVPSGVLTTVYLPWVYDLKGPDTDECSTHRSTMNENVHSKGGAFHLESTVPVTVYQFNALEYAAKGGPDGKSWAGCPGDRACGLSGAMGCLSFSNDASMLLPSTAWSTNYRVIGWDVFTQHSGEGWSLDHRPFLAVTAASDDTVITLHSTTDVVAGVGIGTLGLKPGEKAAVTMAKGDVVEFFGNDFSGSLITSTKPVQVITGNPTTNVPDDVRASDHIEESLFPAESLGKDYLVTLPVAPKAGNEAKQVVRFAGNVDGTALSFDPPIPNVPTTINAGQVITLDGINLQTKDFRVTGNHAFVVATFMLGNRAFTGTGDDDLVGDPSMSLVSSSEQFRKHYIFLAPNDYDKNYVNIVAPSSAEVTLDGSPVASSEFSPIGSSGWKVARVALAPTGDHELQATDNVGIQVYGYGRATSYQYAGGSNFASIAPPPVIK